MDHVNPPPAAVSMKYYHFRTKRSYDTFIYLENNITTSRERNPPSFERGTSYGLFYPILEANMRERNVSENLKKISLILFKCNSLRSNESITRDTYQQFWYTGVVLIIRLDHFFTVFVNSEPFLGF